MCVRSTRTLGVMLCFLIFTFCSIHACRGTIHTSLFQLEELWKQETIAIHLLEDMFTAVKKLYFTLQKYIEDFHNVKLSQPTNTKFLGNPLNAFFLLRHVALGWKQVDEALSILKSQIEAEPFSKNVIMRKNNYLLPVTSDLDGAAYALAKLHATYQFNQTAFSKEGMIDVSVDGFSVRHSALNPPTAWELTTIGLTAVNNKLYGAGVDFLQSALDKSVGDGSQVWEYFGNSIERDRIANFLKTAIKVHDQTLRSKGSISPTHQTHPQVIGSVPVQKVESQKGNPPETVLMWDLHKKNISHKPDVHEYHQALQLCRGETLLSDEHLLKLSCFYGRNNSPWLLLGPMKVEEQSINPYIAVVHELLSEQECDHVIHFMGEKLVTPAKGDTKMEKWTMKHGWPSEADNPVLAKLTKRVQAITGIRAVSNVDAEPFMVANYGIAGSYSVHSDFHGANARQLPPTGDRMATVMTYLIAPEAGGATVFPWVGVTVWPRKGSSVLWWNMLYSGDYDPFTRHMACPVLIGTKWIGNKWIGYWAQWDKLPCSLDRYSKIVCPIN